MENQNNALQTQQVTDLQLGQYLKAMGLAQNLNEKETLQFIEISKAFNLNPFKREIYCTKYGDNFSIIVGYESYIKRAERSNLLNGYTLSTTGSVQNNDLKAIITIHRKDWNQPFVHEVFYSEYVQKTKAGEINKFWREKPITMIKKVAISQGFRMCFSSEIGGMPYTAEEIITEEVPYIDVTEVADCSEAISQVRAAQTIEELANVWKLNKKLQKEVEFIQAKEQRKIELTPKSE